MKYFLSFLIFIYLPRPAIAQDEKKNAMELRSTVLDPMSLQKLLSEKFHAVKMTKSEKQRSNHPLLLLNFNWSLADNKTAFTFFGLHVDSVYVFQNEKSQFCTFLILRIPPRAFEHLATEWGYPENTAKEEYLSDSFDFLFWEKDQFQIFINRHRLSRDTKDKYIVQIFNMHYREIMDFERIE